MNKIVLDAGHGLQTPGKRTPDGMREYEFNRVVAKYAREELLKYQNVTVLFVHEDGCDVPLKERTDRANAWGATAYVSIHANAAGDGGWHSAHGIETFVHPQASAASRNLAREVQANLVKETKLSNRGVKEANFHVLRETRMPAILVECGFMTNQQEAVLLKNDAYRRLCAKAIVDGLVKQFNLRLIPTPQPTPKAPVNKKLFYRVVTGSFNDRAGAERRMEELKKAGFESFLLPYEVE